MANIGCLPLEDVSIAGFSNVANEPRQTVTNFFDCTDGIAKLPYELWRIWHPCGNELPAWLHSCDVFHIAKQKVPPPPRMRCGPGNDAMQTSLVSSVHALYHSIAGECADDSLACFNLLSVCHTLVVVHPGINADGAAVTSKAVAAISFVLCHPTIVIMYVGVDEDFRAGGFGVLLLLLAGKCCIPPEHKVVTRAMVVRVHTEGHIEARRFFENRGFKPSNIPATATTCGGMPMVAAAIVNNAPWMQSYVMFDTNDNDAAAAASPEWLWLELPEYSKLCRGAAWSIVMLCYRQRVSQQHRS